MKTNAEKPSQSNKLFGKSWEIEILISGGAFFSLYQLSNVLTSLLEKLFLVDTSAVVAFLIVILAGGTRMLSIYFAIHLSVRVFWLSSVLLQKIFPQGISVDRLPLVEPYKSHAKNFDIEKRISYLDKLSGLVFSWAVIFVIILFGIGLAFSVAIVPLTLVAKDHPNIARDTFWRVGSLTLIGSSIVFLLDTFFYGILRRWRFVAKIYYPVYWFWNIISLGFVWRPSLQLIFSNVKSRWKTSFWVLLITLFVGILTADESDILKLFDSRRDNIEKTMVEGMRYLDARKTDKSETGGSFIQSEIITDNYLKIFVNYNSNDDKQIDSLKTDDKYFSQLITLNIDDSLYLPDAWIGVNRVSGQRGIQTVLDISHLDKKLHILKIQRTYEKQPVLIPFWKQ